MCAQGFYANGVQAQESYGNHRLNYLPTLKCHFLHPSPIQPHVSQFRRLTSSLGPEPAPPSK